MSLKDLVEKAFSVAKDYLNLPSRESLENIDWSSISSIVTTIGIWLILIGFSALVIWLIRAIGLYKMAKKNNDKLAFLAFIPYGGMFVMGRIIRKNQIIWYRN